MSFILRGLKALYLGENYKIYYGKNVAVKSLTFRDIVSINIGFDLSDLFSRPFRNSIISQVCAIM